jgi:biopolymer transport protein ExbD
MASGAGNFGGGGGGDDSFFAEINITPLVDVVLVLLIIFMITAPVLYQSAIKVQLPKTKTGEARDTSPLSFTLNQSGQLLLDKKAISWDDLPREVSARAGKDPSAQTAVISADEGTPHGIVVKLMDLLRQSGLTRFALSVESQQSSK